MLEEAIAALKLRIGVFIIFTTALCGCSSSGGGASVEDRRPPPSIKLSQHRVSEGETLFSIAWRYALDYRQLARRNGIGSNYTIYPGQLLRLDVGATTSVNSVAKQAATHKKTAPKATLSQPKKSKSQKTKTASRQKKQTPASKKRAAAQLPKGPWRWAWPSSGRLLSAYSANGGLNKGIDVAGRLGESVTAAGPGVVVYSGGGLRGYGNLLIIKHNEKFLSAYAHNRKLLVKEGVAVQAGQKIAEIGSSGTDKVKLHFEIRRDGKPVDPLRYLPKR